MRSISSKLILAFLSIGVVSVLIIAATALARGLDVVTRDERSFPRIAGLGLVRW